MLNTYECQKIESLLRDIGLILIDLKSQYKNNGSWVKTQFKSEVDLIVEKLLKKNLKQLNPDIPIVSEEDLNSHKFYKSDIYWLIDPIDGTASYCNGFNGYVVQLALIKKDKPINSFVYCPELKRMYTAIKGKGSKLNGKKLTVLNYSENITMVDNYPNPKGFSELVFKKLNCSNYLESGSIGLKICLIASGDANLFIKNVVLKDWDLAPGDLILKESGGYLFDFKGKRIKYNTSLIKEEGIIATNSIKTYKLVEDTLNLKRYVE